MKMATWFVIFAAIALGCGDQKTAAGTTGVAEGDAMETTAAPKKRHYEGLVSNGMKGDKISFDISADDTKLENLTFTGYWRCSGRLESTTAGPEAAFDIIQNKVSAEIAEPPNGGSSAWRFEFDAVISGKNASGTFRMNINNLGCDSYVLKWTASAK